MSYREENGSVRKRALHPDAREIVKLLKHFNVSLADRDWDELVEWTDAAVRHANETGYRRGKREKRP
jgi:hypothetical protein